MRIRNSLAGGPVVISVSLLLLCFASNIQAQQRFGYVLDVKGDWNSNQTGKVSKGAAVNVGSVISAGNPSDASSYIVIADHNGNIVERRNCANSGECSSAIRLPAAASSNQGVVSRLLGAAMALVSSEPAKYATFVSRGSDLKEAVIKLNEQKLDLSPVFKNMPADKYLVRFEKIDKDGSSAPALKPFPFTWDARKPEPLVARDLGPGLYRVSVLEVSLLETDGGSEPSGNEAWVLVSTPTTYTKAAPSFDAALNVTKQWGTSVKQNAVRQFLRASLQFITTQTK